MKRVYLLLGLSFALVGCSKDKLAKLPPETKAEKSEKKNSGVHKEKDPAPSETSSSPVQTPTEPSSPVSTPISPAPAPTSVDINRVPATVYATETSQLSFETSGYIEKVYVKNSDFVKKGQPIASLDSRTAAEQLKLAQYTLLEAQKNAHFAQSALKRAETLNARQATTQVALEQAQQAEQLAHLSVDQAKSQLKLAQITYDATTLRAPFDGYVSGLSLWIGNYVSSTSFVVKLVSIKNLQIQIPVPQTVQNTFHVKQELHFESSSQKTNGKVVITGVIPYVDPDTKTYLIVGIPKDVSGTLMGGELVVVDLK